MLSVCFYFQVHQPYRIRRYQFFDIGNSDHYFDDEKNRAVLQKVARKCYLPTNNVLLGLLQKNPEFKISFSFSGVVLDQFEHDCPEVLQSFQDLVATGQVELLSETYYHSLACMFCVDEFVEQIRLHGQKIKKLFGVTPTVLRNTELIYHNDIAQIAKDLGYHGVLLEGADKLLDWRSPNYVYQAPQSGMKLLLKNYRLSDDIAFRFSDRGWKEFPLTAPKYASWLNNVHGNGTNVNLFMDYETFGEHQWHDTGIFDFLEHLPGELAKHPDTKFRFPSEIIAQCDSVGELDVPYYVSWADIERDVSAWLGNDMQRSAMDKLYALKDDVNKAGCAELKKTWRKLQTSDLFYYMCVKWFNDGDVHKYFSPYDSPYDAFIYFMNVYSDFKQRLQDRISTPKPTKKRMKRRKVPGKVGYTIA